MKLGNWFRATRDEDGVSVVLKIARIIVMAGQWYLMILDPKRLQTTGRPHLLTVATRGTRKRMGMAKDGKRVAVG